MPKAWWRRECTILWSVVSRLLTDLTKTKGKCDCREAQWEDHLQFLEELFQCCGLSGMWIDEGRRDHYFQGVQKVWEGRFFVSDLSKKLWIGDWSVVLQGVMVKGWFYGKLLERIDLLIVAKMCRRRSSRQWFKRDVGSGSSSRRSHCDSVSVHSSW